MAFITRNNWVVFWVLLLVWVVAAFLWGNVLPFEPQCDDVRPRGC